MSGIEWIKGNPSRRKMQADAIDEIVAELQKQPGTWAIVRRKPNVKGSYDMQGYKRPYQRRGCLTSVTMTDDGTGIVYACWPASGGAE